MTKRALPALALSAMLLLCALSTRGALFWQLFWTMLAMFALGFFSVQWTSRTLSLRCSVAAERVTRGAEVTLTLRLRHLCPLPVAALRLTISAADLSRREKVVSVKPFVYNTLSEILRCPHVGRYPAAVSSVCVEDVFGLFRSWRGFKEAGTELVVEPRVRETPPLAFSAGDSDRDIAMAKAFQDATLPTDVRLYQPGDALKKVHWKLSMRRREIFVRVFEQPIRPDALLLVDCAPPLAADAEAAAGTRDAICEAAAGACAAALSGGASVRMPLASDPPVEVKADKPEEIRRVTEALGRLTFNAPQQFERVLLLEAGRLRRAGATLIVAGRMNPVIADMALRIRRMGPKVRVLLAADLEREEMAAIVARLLQNDVEVFKASAEPL